MTVLPSGELLTTGPIAPKGELEILVIVIGVSQFGSMSGEATAVWPLESASGGSKWG